MMKKILYILWNERIDKGLFKTQVLDLLEFTQNNNVKDVQIDLVCFVPLISLRYYRSFIGEMDNLVVNVHVLPSIALFSYIFLHPILLVILQLQVVGELPCRPC